MVNGTADERPSWECLDCRYREARAKRKRAAIFNHNYENTRLLKLPHVRIITLILSTSRHDANIVFLFHWWHYGEITSLRKQQIDWWQSKWLAHIAIRLPLYLCLVGLFSFLFCRFNNKCNDLYSFDFKILDYEVFLLQ